MGGGGGIPLDYTPTWVIAAVCSVIVLISFTVERLIHSIGKYLKKKKKPKALFEALQKLKEELMLLGFISLLLGVFQNAISGICIPENLTHKFLPCNKKQGNTREHFQISFRRSLLSKTSGESPCGKDKVPLLSVDALHDLHIFIFVLATVHVISTVLTIILGLTKIREWQRWENSILEGKYDPNQVLQKIEIDVNDHAFVRGNFMCGKNSAILGWMSALIKQFHHSVTKSDYITLRQGFVMRHCKDIPEFNFYKYMIRCLEDDFKQVVGIRWYLWIVVVIFLLLNVDGWHVYFWLSFLPLILLFVVGTKLEHVMVELAREAAKTHQKGEGKLVIEPKDDHFWFHRPHIVLNLIHFILFQNAFEMAVFFWIWIMFGFNCCIMGQIYFIIPRLVIGIIVQLMCSYSTLPLYAIVTQMGSSFKAAIFSKTVNRGIAQWVQDAHKKMDLKEKKDSTIEVQSEIVDDKV